MPTVEGLTPALAWSTLYGIFAFGLLFLIGFKVYDALHTIIERRKQKKEAEQPDFAKRVSKEVISELSPRLNDIETKLANDDERIKIHDKMLKDIKNDQSELHEGLSAIAKFMLAIGTHGELSNDEHIKSAVADLQKFLAEKL